MIGGYKYTPQHNKNLDAKVLLEAELILITTNNIESGGVGYYLT